MRLKKAKKIHKIVVAFPDTLSDKKIKDECKKLKISFFQGPEDDVLKGLFSSKKI